MRPNALERQRRWFGGALLAGFWLFVLWFFSPGLPVLFGPWASAATREAGRELFERDWSPNDPAAHGDGLGPVFNARSCVACHFQGGVGGGGSLANNIQTFEVVPNARDADGVSGTVHAFATAAQFKESLGQVRRRYPVIRGSTRTVTSPDGHCSYREVIPDVDPLRVYQLQPTALFGAGWIDRLSAKALDGNLMGQAAGNIAKEFQLDFSAVPPGRVRVLPDGRVGKFGWQAQFATLEEFVAAACANELGLGTPVKEQIKPFGHEVSAPPDLDRKQFKALLAFVDTLPRPVEVLPDDPAARDRAAQGKQLFASVGCVACHTPDLGGVKGVYSDLLLHSVEDRGADGRGGYDAAPQELPLPDHLPRAGEWRTSPLWGVADSAPYLHDGRAKTLREAILHHGGDAKTVRDAFRKLPAADQEAVLAFLRTLKAPADAVPVVRLKR